MSSQQVSNQAYPIPLETLLVQYADVALYKILKVQGNPLVLRRPTQEEVIRYEDRISILTETREGPSNLMDDGDKEILACIVYPESTQVQKLYRRQPGMPTNLRKYWQKLACQGLVYEEQDESSISDEIRSKHKGKELICFRLLPVKFSIPDEVIAALRAQAEDEDSANEAVKAKANEIRKEQSKLIICSMLEPMQVKMLQAKGKKGVGQFRLNRKDLVDAMEHNLISPNKETLKEWGEETPYLRYDIAQLLFGAASADIEEYEGK